jgi:hypothetical protein
MSAPLPTPKDEQMQLLMVGPSDDDMRELFRRAAFGNSPAAMRRETRRMKREQQRKETK